MISQPHLAISSSDVGDCKDGELLACSRMWTGGNCRWDCKEVSSLEQAFEVDNQTFITFADKEDPRSKFSGCHYSCWKECVLCPNAGKKNFVTSFIIDMEISSSKKYS